MKRPIKLSIVAVAAAAALAVSAGVSLAGGLGGNEEVDTPVTGEALVDASAAALAHTGGGRVTDTEAGDEESYYEVEVTLPDGRQVDVQLDREFKVVGSSADAEGAGTGADD